MKKRIVALILTVVMSLLVLTSCGGFDFAEEDLTAYAEFNLDEFNKALQNIKIKDHDFTGDDATRNKIVDSTIYNAVANKLLADVTAKDHNKTGNLTAGDAVYFVYFAKDAEGNEYFFTEMDEASVTAAATKENHTVKLGDYFYTATSSTKDDEKLLQLVIDNVKLENIDKYIYSTLTKTEIENAAIEALKQTNPDATDDDKTAAKKEALTVKEGDTICVSYTRTHTNKEGAELTYVASYYEFTVKAGDPFSDLFLAEGTTALVGSNLANEGNKFQTVVGEGDDAVTYNYSNINIRWKVENKGEPIATFEYTPYTSAAAKTPSSLFKKTGDKMDTIDLNGKKLTYYVYPVYYVNLPSYSEITAEQILYHVYNTNLKSDTLEVLSDNGYTYEGKTLEALFTELSEAVKAAGSKPTAEQKIGFEKIIKKIANATKDGKSIAPVVLEQYRENIYHGLVHNYNSHINTEVNSAVNDLIKNSVTIKAYPEKLVKEFRDHLYESYEYDFYKGSYDKTTTNYTFYNGDFDLYLVKTLKLNNISELDKVLEAKAKEYIEPMIKVHVIAQHVAPEALKVMAGYIESDIKSGIVYEYGVGGKYYLHENDASALKNARAWGKQFIVNDAYMKQYKKTVGSAVYRNEIDTYGELNLRTAKQYEVLFYYLTCTDVTYDAETGHLEQVFENGKIAYRTLKYDFK